MDIELKITQNDWGTLTAKLQRLPDAARVWGGEWTKDSAQKMDDIYRDRLSNQGRGGEPPPLSTATRHLYSQLGEPDGSGIRNHLTIEYEQTARGFVAVFGIPEGRPSLIARVQDRGAVIPVSDAMRGFLAAHGIFLKATTTHIEIPARHSWEHSIDDVEDYAKSRLRSFWKDMSAIAN